MQFVFADHTLDTERRELRRGTEAIAVEPQVLDLLICLVENRNRVVTKNDLIASVWGGRVVSEATLSSRPAASRLSVMRSLALPPITDSRPAPGVKLALIAMVFPFGRGSAAQGCVGTVALP